jgi:hypothetical protein
VRTGCLGSRVRVLCAWWGVELWQGVRVGDEFLLRGMYLRCRKSPWRWICSGMILFSLSVLSISLPLDKSVCCHGRCPQNGHSGSPRCSHRRGPYRSLKSGTLDGWSAHSRSKVTPEIGRCGRPRRAHWIHHGTLLVSCGGSYVTVCGGGITCLSSNFFINSLIIISKF